MINIATNTGNEICTIAHSNEWLCPSTQAHKHNLKLSSMDLRSLVRSLKYYIGLLLENNVEAFVHPTPGCKITNVEMNTHTPI